MLRRLVCPALWWLAVAGAAAGESPPDAIHVLEVRTGWEYGPTADPPAADRLPEAWRPVTLPRRLDAEPCGFYRASFALPAAWAGRRVTLVVRPLGGRVWAWLNGQFLGVRAPTALDVRLDAAGAARPGARNTLLVAVSAPGELDREGLSACWLEATGALGVRRLAVATWCLGQRAVVDVALDVANGTRERFEGKVELALEAEAEGKQPPRVWRRDSDVRLDPFGSAQGRPGQSASVGQSFEPDPPRLWRFDDPFLYRLTATVRTREGEAPSPAEAGFGAREARAVQTTVRRVGVASAEAASGRWLVNREWLRLAAIAFTTPGATLLCTQPGQASALAEKIVGGVSPRRVSREADIPPTILPLDELLDFCDEAGILALLDAPAGPPETPGWREAADALAAEALRHPCVCGWVVQEGGPGDEGQGAGVESENPKSEIRNPKSALARLRELTPRLPIGRPMPDLAADAAGFDFLVARFATKAAREDDDGYGRRLDDLVRDAGGKAILAIDRVTVAADQEAEDRLKAELRTRTDGSLARRSREAERRWPVAALAFELNADDGLFAVAEKQLCPFRLNPPHHEARMDREQFVVKSRFEAHLASPVAQRLPCYSLAGHRIAWRATRADAVVASGTRELSPSVPRALDGGCNPGRGEVEWRSDKPGDIEFAAELQSAAGRVLARHRAKLTLSVKDGRAELAVQPLEKPQAAPPPPAAAKEVECVHVDALAGHFNNDGLSWRANPSDGNFDFPSRREGNCFIADLLPKKGALVAVPGHDAVTFRFPDKDDRLRNNVLCDGQRLQFAGSHLHFALRRQVPNEDVTPEAFDAVWFLGACHDGARAALLTIDYEDGQAQGELRLADWLSKPAAGEIGVLRLPALHTFDGKEDARECGLVAWRVPLDPKRKLIAITLPRERNMHVFALTLTRNEREAP